MSTPKNAMSQPHPDSLTPEEVGAVMRAAGDRLEIVHYQLSIAVPNGVQPQVTELIAGAAGE